MKKLQFYLNYLTKLSIRFGQRKVEILSVLLFCFLSVSSNAQSITAHIGAGGATTSENVPIKGANDYTYSQQIYLASELIAAGASAAQSDITKIRFKVNTPGDFNKWKTWTVYLGNTANSEFAAVNSWITTANMIRVANNVTINGGIAPATGTWVEVDFSATPFVWDGVSNIVVAIDEHTAGRTASSHTWDAYAATGSPRALSIYKNKPFIGTGYYNPDAPGNPGYQSATLSQIQFEIVALPNCTGTPSAGTVDNNLNVCKNRSFALTTLGSSATSGIANLTGIWQSSAPGMNAWTDIAGSEDLSTFVYPGISVPTEFRYVMYCSSSNQTDISGTILVAINNINDCYCVPSVTTLDGYINNFSTTQGVNTNISNLTSGLSANGYGNFISTQAVDREQGWTVGVSGNLSNSKVGVRIWVDWNQDGDFDDAGEAVYTYNSGSFGGSANFNGSFLVPQNAQVGITRMRVGALFNSSSFLSYSAPANSCSNLTEGEYEDYTFEVLPMPSCATVTFPGTVTPTTNANNFCESGSFNLNISTAIPIATDITYQWQSASSPAGPWMDEGSEQSAPLKSISNIHDNTYYRVQVLCQQSLVVTSDNLLIIVENPRPVVTNVSLCSPASVTLTATPPTGNNPVIRWYANASGGTLLTTGTSYNTPVISSTTTYYVSASLGNTAAPTFMGTGTSTTYTSTNSTNYINPFYTYYKGQRNQFLILASELQAAGFVAGKVSKLAFSTANTSYAYELSGFTIQMKNTATSTLDAWETGLTQVYSNTVSPSNGTTTITLTGNFVWDGTSNVVIQTCFDNGDYNSGDFYTVKYTTNLGFNASRYSYTDNAGPCTSTSNQAVSTSRPNIQFTMAPGCESSRVPVTVEINTTPATSGIIVGDYINGNGGTTYTFSPGTVTGTSNAYAWNFGDGNSSIDENPEHTYAQDGDYQITLDVTNSCGNTTAYYILNGVLPIEMDLLKGQLDEKNVPILSWNTFKEINNKGFEMQQSINGKSFQNIGFVATKAENGNSHETISYHFKNASSLKGTAYYRFRQYNWDGTSSYSNIVALSATTIEPLSLSAYPNPTGNKVTIDIRGKMESNAQILITDIMGKEIKKLNMIGNSIIIDMSELSSGTYLIKYVDSMNASTIKINKQ